MLPYPKFKATDAAGLPLVGGKLYTYIGGTNTEKVSYSDRACTIANTNPVILDSLGEASVFLKGLYKLMLYKSDDTYVWSIDNIEGIDIPEKTMVQGSIAYRDASTWENLSPGSDGDVLTSGGTNANPSWKPVPTLFDTVYKYTFATGTKALFYQDTAPPGWTIDSALDDKLIFVTKGSAAGGEIGGGAHASGTWTISGNTVTVQGHSLTEYELAPHSHSFPACDATVGTGNYGPQRNEIDTSLYTTWPTSSVGSGAAHNHGATINHNGLWRPSAYCCIICTKDAP